MTAALDYVEDILEAVEKIDRYTAGMDYEEFVEDDRTVDAVLRNFEVIGEAAKNVPWTYARISTRFPGRRWPGCGTN